MHDREPDANRHEGEPESREKKRRPEPRIYVASLADYNEGRLHGAWIDAAQSAEELQDAVKEMLQASPSPDAEEWAIHDYEGFGPLRLDEFESLEVVAKVAAGIAKHGEVFAVWANYVGLDSDLLDGFEDAYTGEYDSGADFAEEMLAELGLLEPLIGQLPEDLRSYVQIDYQGYFDDLVSNGQIAAVASRGGGVYVFRIW